MESRVSEEARRELHEYLAKLSMATATKPTPITPLKSVARRTTRRTAVKKEPSLTDYIRERYEDDQVLMSFADVIDMNPAMWRAMGQFYNLDIRTGDGLSAWTMTRSAEAAKVLTTTLTLDIVDKEGTVRARSR